MEKSEIKLEFLGPQGFNPFVVHESSPRSFMFGSHFSQRQPLLTPEKRKIRTGIEHEFKKYVDQIKADDDLLVHRVINKYPKSIYDDFPFSPETAVLCSKQINDNTIGLELIVIKRHNSFHSKFGFPYKFNIDPSEIKAGVEIKKDTVIAEPYSVMEDGSYAYGVNANAVLMSHYGIPEDGVVVSRDFLKKLGFTLYEKRVINLGRKDIPLNLYGDEMNYKPFPYLGEEVRESGLLYSSRVIDDNFLPADVNRKALKNVSQLFDKKIFVKPGSIVVDIDILKNPMSRDTIPLEIAKYFNKFSNLKTKYYREIRDAVYMVTKELTEKYANINIVHGFDLHHKLVEAEAFISSIDKKNKIELVDRAVPVDEYKIEITVMTKMYPNYGYKLTDVRGGKGVICGILDRDKMPVDKDGNVADIIMDNSSTVSRMNFGRLYESYIGGTIRDFENRLKNVLGLSGVSTPYKTLNHLKGLLVKDKTIVVEAYNKLLRFYQIINEEQFEFFYNLTEDKKIEHLSEVISDGLIVHYRTDTIKDITKTIKELEEEFTPTYGPVTYFNAAGKKVTTKANVRVGSFYILLLDKITDQYMATSSATLNHFGFPSKVTSQEKYSYPHATTAARTIGETETRILTSYLGDEAIAELMDINGSVTSHKQVVKNILTNDSPMRINKIIDRAVIPYGGTKALQILKHMTRTEGWDVKYEPER